MFIDREACAAFWRAYLAALPAGHAHHHSAQPDAFGFGSEAVLASQLVELVLAGRKRATTSLPIEYTSLGEALPRAGDLSIVVRGDGQPAALIARTHVVCVPFEQVDERYARVEGEGDGTLADWRAAHLAYFGSVCARLGGQFDQRTPVLCQTFRLLWPVRG
jgi:uncharacterized protein YhfF